MFTINPSMITAVVRSWRQPEKLEVLVRHLLEVLGIGHVVISTHDASEALSEYDGPKTREYFQDWENVTVVSFSGEDDEVLAHAKKIWARGMNTGFNEVKTTYTLFLSSTVHIPQVTFEAMMAKIRQGEQLIGPTYQAIDANGTEINFDLGWAYNGMIRATCALFPTSLMGVFYKEQLPHQNPFSLYFEGEEAGLHGNHEVKYGYPASRGMEDQCAFWMLHQLGLLHRGLIIPQCVRITVGEHWDQEQKKTLEERELGPGGHFWHVVKLVFDENGIYYPPDSNTQYFEAFYQKSE